jgi:hypothetical protein
VTPGDLQRWAQVAEAKHAAEPNATVVSDGGALRGGGLDIVFNITSGFPAGADVAMETAAAYIESQFSDDVTVSIDVDFQNLGGGVIGSTGTFMIASFWTNALPGLVSGMDPDDFIQDWLPAGTTIPVRYDGASATVTDENRVFFTRSNFRATIGNTVGIAANMTFNSSFLFDFDPSNGILIGRTCFQSVVVHEVGHALGFTSNADGGTLDIDALDLFRFQFSDGTGDYNPDTLEEFQIRPRLVDFNTPNDSHIVDVITGGEFRMEDGSPWQASHFRQTVNAIMDPNLAAGETFYPNFYRNADLTMLDAIGWDFPPVIVGDCDGDGTLDMPGDLPCFVDALLGIDTMPPGGIARSNINGDATTDGGDAQGFVDCLTTGCP